MTEELTDWQRKVEDRLAVIEKRLDINQPVKYFCKKHKCRRPTWVEGNPCDAVYDCQKCYDEREAAYKKRLATREASK